MSDSHTPGIFTSEPEGFLPKVHVAGVFCRVNDRFLLLKRAPGKPQEGTWGIPSGKQEVGESLSETARRELFEEVGLVSEVSQLKQLGVLYILLKSGLEYTYTIFQLIFSSFPDIQLEYNEHTDFVWCTRDEALSGQYPLIYGADRVMTFLDHR